MLKIKVAALTVSLLILSLAASPLWAQKDAGAIVGSVHDPTGAVVAGAKVVVTDADRGTVVTVVTNAEGEYVASPLRIGRYTVSVEHPGYKKAVSPPVDINVQDRVAVNISLQVGKITESVVVTDIAPALQTETSELGEVVDSKQVANLPLNGRNFAQLALLSAGTAPSEPGARDEKAYGFSAGGARSLQNNFLLDGVDNNSNLPDLLNETNFVIQPPVEALQEFKVQTNAYGAEFGRGNGAIINAAIKSGSNQFHGSAWEFLRNDKLDSRNYFDPVGAVPKYIQNQFGFTIGGPIIKNRTFFFFDYEGLRVRQAQTQTAFIPPTIGSNWRLGDFSNLIDYTNPVTTLAADGVTQVPALDCNGVQTYAGEIFDTRLTNTSSLYATGLCGMPFGYNGGGLPVNTIPSAATLSGGGFLDPLALRLSALYPQDTPINPVSGNNFTANPVLQESRTNFDIRVDHKYTDNDYGFFRFSFEEQPSTIPGSFGGLADGGGFFSGDERNSYRSFATSWTHIFHPSLVNEFRLGYNRVNSQRFQLNSNTDVSSQLGFPGVPFSPGIGGLPQLTFSDGTATLGSPTFLPSKELQNSYTLSENLTWVKGLHSFKFGTEIRHEEFTIFQPAAPRGTLNFGPESSDNPAAPGTGGNGFASFMAGLSDGGSINNLHNVDYFRNTYAFYTQDDWKLSPRLTLNLGLRYELFMPVTERNNDIATFDLTHPATPTLIVPRGQSAQLTPTIASEVQISPTGSKGLINKDLNNFAPRIGFAFLLQPKTVLRAGYGVFYGGQENGPYSNPSPGFNPPFFVTQSFSTPCSAPSTNPNISTDCSLPGIRFLADGFPADSLVDPNTPTFFSVDQNLRTPYMQQWHASIQRELPSDSVFDITYAGSKGTRLYTFFNGNQAAPSPDPTAAYAPRRPVPLIDAGIDWFRSTGASEYHSLQAHFEKRFNHGLQFQSSYTYGHSIDNASNANLGPTQNNSDFRDFRHPEAEKGNSDFDVRHRLVGSFIYALPIGKGQAIAGSSGRLADEVIGGWQIASIVSISTGNFFTVLDGNGNFANADGGAGGVSQRPDQVGNPNATPCVAGTRFNTCAFADPAQGSFGDVRRNTIEGPGYRTWDFSVFKNFTITERTKLEFRGEFFNVLNHTNFLFARSGPQNGNNSTIFGTSQFGLVTAARDPRQIQFALRLSF